MQSSKKKGEVFIEKIPNNTQSDKGKTYSEQSHQVSHIQSPRQVSIVLTLLINNEKYATNCHGSTKYSDYLHEIHETFFKDLFQENHLILSQGWNPIFPKSNDSTITESIQNTNLHLKAQNITDLLLDQTNQINLLQETNIQQQNKIQTFQIDHNNDLKEIQKLNEFIAQMQTKQKIYEMNFSDLNIKYEFYQKSIKKYMESLKFQKINENLIQQNEAQKQQRDKIQQFQQQIEQQIAEIDDLKQRNSNLMNQVTQLQKLQKCQQQIQQKQSNDTQQLKQNQNAINPLPIQNPLPIYQSENILQKQSKGDINNIENNRDHQLQQNNLSSNQLNDISPEIENLRQSSKEQNEDDLLYTLVFDCFNCGISCTEHISLPCQHKYHQECLQELGIKAYIDQQSSAKCKCSRKIPTRLLKKETQQILFSLQAAQIFNKYEHSLSLINCRDCEYFFIANAGGKSYCPNCLKFISVQ